MTENEKLDLILSETHLLQTEAKVRRRFSPHISPLQTTLQITWLKPTRNWTISCSCRWISLHRTTRPPRHPHTNESALILSLVHGFMG